MTPITNRIILPPEKGNEEIIVVRRDILFKDTPAWHGLKEVDMNYYSDLITSNKEIMLRSFAENDVNYKQIIPYIVFKYQDTYFLMERGAKTTESRLANKYSLGIGGHMRTSDITSSNIIQWGQREFQEEVVYDGNVSYEVLGIINDDTYDVGKVHIGIVLCATGDTDDIAIRSELKMGTLVNLETCIAHFNKLETWSQHVVTFLQKSL